jgi:hypothetical protein
VDLRGQANACLINFWPHQRRAVLSLVELGAHAVCGRGSKRTTDSKGRSSRSSRRRRTPGDT